MPTPIPQPPKTAPLAKLLGSRLTDLVPLLFLTEPAASLVAQCADNVAALEALEAANLLTEATRLTAHALPRREAVWWACMCARHTSPNPMPPADQRALEDAESWVFKGEDALRRRAFEHAQESNFATPEAWAGVAAFWSGDSMAPLGQAPVPPAAHLAGTAVAGSVLLAAVRDPPDRRTARLGRFLASARDIAAGGTGRLAAEEAVA
jgi:hypothetical protein